MTAPVIPGSLVSWGLMTPDEVNDMLAGNYRDSYLPPQGETIMFGRKQFEGIARVDQNRLKAIRRERGNPRANYLAFTAVGRAARLERLERERNTRFVEQQRAQRRSSRTGR